MNFVRRTKLRTLALPGVLLLDSIGDLAALFERADVVFMGGTLARRGGHNILEPAFFAKPVIVGPHMENFAAIVASFTPREAVEKYRPRRRSGNRRCPPARQSWNAGNACPRARHVETGRCRSHRKRSLDSL